MRVILLFAFSAFCTVGCGAAQKPQTTQWKPGIYDLRTGEKVDHVTFQKAVTNAKVVLVGESHDSVSDHARQIEVIEMFSGSTKVGMEMFQRPFQDALDRYSAGEITEEQMLLDTEWEDRWGFETELYRPIWRLAKRKGFSIIALNLRTETTKKISGHGYDSLSDEEKSSLPEFDFSNVAYKKWLRTVFDSHGAILDDEKFEQFFQAQVAWDETMADTAFKALQTADHVVMIVGRGHVERDWGIPSRLRRRLHAEFGDGVVLSIIPSDGKLPTIEVLRKQRFADFVWIVPQTPKN